MNQKMKCVLKGILKGTLACILLLVLISVIYMSIYYHATEQVMEQIQNDLAQKTADYTVTRCENGDLILEPQICKAGIILYPGGKVQMEAYYPLMQKLAEDGYLCILLKLTGNLAVLEPNAADGYIEKYRTVNEWYLAGHSLGGWAASSYLESHLEDYHGLILLAAYSTTDYKSENVPALSIYGSQDEVLSKETYENYRDNLPLMKEYVIDGGCHAYFGAYGSQKGDGKPTISQEEQISITADVIDDFIAENHLHLN